MLSDQKFRFLFIKQLSEYKEKTGNGVYFMDDMEEEMMSEANLL